MLILSNNKIMVEIDYFNNHIGSSEITYSNYYEEGDFIIVELEGIDIIKDNNDVSKLKFFELNITEDLRIDSRLRFKFKKNTGIKNKFVIGYLNSRGYFDELEIYSDFVIIEKVL